MSALQRWDSFLDQIETRHAQVRKEAEAAGLQFIASVARGGDYQALSHQLGAVKSRLQDLETNITDTWHAKVDPAFADEGADGATRARAFGQGQALRHRLDDAREELEIGLLAELARQRYAAALATARAVACTRCGAARPAPMAFRAIELACACGAQIGYEPGELLRSVAAIGAHAIAQEAATAPWRAMRAAERALHAIRPPHPLDAIKAYERAQIAYWRHYLAVRAQLEPELARDPALEIRSRMEHWYTWTAEHEPAWQQAGWPRDPI